MGRRWKEERVWGFKCWRGRCDGGGEMVWEGEVREEVRVRREVKEEVV